MRVPASRLSLVLLLFCVGVARADSDTFTLDERIAVERALLRVKLGWVEGAPRPSEVVPGDEAILARVRRVAEESAALERAGRPLSAEALAREIERMVDGSRQPERLRSLFAALGNDPLRIQEGLARPALVARSRLYARGSDSSDPGFRQADAGPVEFTIPEPDPRLARAVARLLRHEQTGCVPDSWRRGALHAVPEILDGFLALWTGTEMIMWRTDLSSDGRRREGWRYDPSIDSWSPMSTRDGPPQSIHRVVAAWSGREFILLGHYFTEDGARHPGLWRYEPETDRWTRGTTDGAPDTYYATEVTPAWTGKEMVLWTGRGFSDRPIGALYDPDLDRWRPMADAPLSTPRREFSSVWTGRELIVYGGVGDPSNQVLRDGARYDPAADAWSLVSALNAPLRASHRAIWTGREMFLWGGVPGENGGPSSVGSGWSYEPEHDRWLAMPVLGQPTPPRSPMLRNLVWTGRELVVWTGTEPRRGARYRPDLEMWLPMSSAGAPPGDLLHVPFVWTGTEALFWTGQTGWTMEGARYDPERDAWTPMDAIGRPSARIRFASVWTGYELMIWGGESIGRYLGDGARYDPVTDSWAPIASEGAPSPRVGAASVWTGREWFVWGGFSSFLPGGGDRRRVDGAMYDPLLDRWRPIPNEGAPGPRDHGTPIGTVWMGNEVFLFGGGCEPESNCDAKRYDPERELWTPVSPPGPRPGGQRLYWTGKEVIVWGLASQQLSAGRYDPASDMWFPIEHAPLFGVHIGGGGVGAWTGRELIVWDANDSPRMAAYDPAAGSWRQLSTVSGPTARIGASGAWTGRELIVWGGELRYAPNDPTVDRDPRRGGRYDYLTDTWSPMTLDGAPDPRSEPALFWTGSTVLMWGGNRPISSGSCYIPACGAPCPDRDRDGFAACEVACEPAGGTPCGDCDERRPYVHPGTIEGCDDLDNDCDPDTADGLDEPWLGESCDGADPDGCLDGVMTCRDGEPFCADEPGGHLERADIAGSCSNGEDDDCDSTSDTAEALCPSPERLTPLLPPPQEAFEGCGTGPTFYFSPGNASRPRLVFSVSPSLSTAPVRSPRLPAGRSDWRADEATWRRIAKPGLRGALTYWTVESEGGSPARSEVVHSFRIAPESAGTPLSPRDYLVPNDRVPSFAWTPAPCQAQVQIEIAGDAAFTSVEMKLPKKPLRGGSSYAMTTKESLDFRRRQLLGRTFYWRLATKDQAGRTAYSEPIVVYPVPPPG